ncbi:MAG: DNA repair exonuclease [Lachnospiraceae bacterium]|nr:DNA repair exonuclease [Lachnospiraceae bacterium]
MKIIHCADLHLDSKMETHLDEKFAAKRRFELLMTFRKMIDYAVEKGVEAVIIAGDLFDKKTVSKEAKNTVRDAILNNPSIEFYYLRGNHDAAEVFKEAQSPSNLHTFGDEWTHYSLNGVDIWGCERADAGPDGLSLNRDAVNIVVLHGQAQEYRNNRDKECIALSEYRNLGIDYMALGHIHEYTVSRLDARGIFCYSGCLEGRGFDECGEHGFSLIEIDVRNHKIDNSFENISQRTLYEVSVDVGDCMDDVQVVDVVRDELSEASIDSKNMVKIILTGSRAVDAPKITIDGVCESFAGDYFFIKVKDETKVFVDYNSFANDKSLRGEFVRKVLDRDDISEDDKSEIIRLGISALAGEDVK